MFAAVKLRAVLGLALVGGAAGIHLGRSAIAEINPVHFGGSEGASAFYADLTPRGESTAGWNSLSTSPPPVQLDASCIGCRTYPEEYYPVPDPAVESLDEFVDEGFEHAVQVASYPTELSPEEARIKADLERVAIYASAPVTAEEASLQGGEAGAPPTELNPAY